MAHSDSSDTFAAEHQLDMFGAERPQRDPAPESVRAELADVLAQVRDAAHEPLDSSDAAHFRNIFFRMSERLPEDEATQLRLEFEAELSRRKAA